MKNFDVKETWEVAALDAIGVVDYDIEKECHWEIEDEGSSILVDEMNMFLQELCDQYYTWRMKNDT